MSSSNDDSLVSSGKDQSHHTRFPGWPYVGIAVIPFAVGWGLVRRRRRSRRLVRSCWSSWDILDYSWYSSDAEGDCCFVSIENGDGQEYSS